MDDDASGTSGATSRLNPRTLNGIILAVGSPVVAVALAVLVAVVGDRLFPSLGLGVGEFIPFGILFLGFVGFVLGVILFIVGLVGSQKPPVPHPPA